MGTQKKVDGNTTIIMERIKRIEARDYQSVPSRGRRTRESDIIQVEPELPEDRFQKPNKGHECERVTKKDSKPGCIFCTYVWKMKRYHNEKVGIWKDEIKRTNFRYLYCKVPCCQFCFNVYHTFVRS